MDVFTPSGAAINRRGLTEDDLEALWASIT